jgi:hypothetical protein
MKGCLYKAKGGQRSWCIEAFGQKYHVTTLLKARGFKSYSLGAGHEDILIWKVGGDAQLCDGTCEERPLLYYQRHKSLDNEEEAPGVMKKIQHLHWMSMTRSQRFWDVASNALGIFPSLYSLDGCYLAESVEVLIF